MQQGKVSGEVVKVTGPKTAVVLINRLITHPRYKKQYKRSKKIIVHDPKGIAKVGQRLEIASCRPISGRKRWIIIDSGKADKS